MITLIRKTYAVIARRKRAVLLILMDMILFFLVNPKKAPSIVLMLGLVLLLATLYLVIGAIVDIVGRKAESIRKRAQKIKILTVAVAAFILGLSSLGQLTGKDVWAIVPLLLVGFFYLTYPDRAEN